MAFNNKSMSCSQDPRNSVENGEVVDHASDEVGVVGVNGSARNDSSTDDGPESPESPIQQNFKKKSAIRKEEGNNTAESTPDKRECPCELCTGVSNVQLLREDRNQNINIFDTESEGGLQQKRVNGISSDEGVPTENGVYFENGHLDLPDHIADQVSNTCGDGMELYFRDNVHLFEHDIESNGASTPEASPRNESLNVCGNVNGVTSWGVGDYVNMTCSSSRHSGMQSSNGYGSDKGSHRGSDYDSDEGGVYVLPDDLIACTSKHTPLNDSSEDQGDFIEADIPKNPYACSGDSSDVDSRRNSISSSYEDLRESNICPPNSANRTSGDEETFTKLVFHSEYNRSGSSNRQEQLRSSAVSYHSPNLSITPVQPSTSNAPVLRPTNLFDSRVQNGSMDRSNIMFTSASTESSSPFTMSSAAFMSPSYSDNSTSALNAPTSESSVFASPDRELDPGSNAARRREAFLRNQSMDNPETAGSPCPLRPAKSSGDIEHGAEEKEEFSTVHSTMTMSRSLYQNLGRSYAPQNSAQSSMMCRHCNKQHGNDQTTLKRSGSAGVSIVEGNDQSHVVLPDEPVLRSNSEELLDSDSCPQVVCLSCHRQRFGTFSCDRNDCDVLEQAMRKHQCCLHGRCTCSLAYYFSCVIDGSSEAGDQRESVQNEPNLQSHSSHSMDVRPRNSDAAINSQNSLNRCSQHRNNLSRRVHHYIHHLHNIDNVTRQNASALGSGDNLGQGGPENGQCSHNSAGGVLRNVREISGAGQAEIQENENNDNIENGRALMQNVASSSQDCSINVSQASASSSNLACARTNEQLARDRVMRELKFRGDVDYSRGRSKNSGIRILPLLLRSANTIDEMDPEAVMELSSMLQNDDESEDDGYVDFPKILKDYMVHKFYEKHSIASQWYSCDLEGHNRIDTTMIWTEYQAYLYHERQIGRSACGATAAINVLKAFNLEVDQDAVRDAIKTNLRDETADVPKYLLSRSVAGTTAQELIDGVSKLTHGEVYGRFFHMHPLRRVCIRKWLSSWIQKGAVPLVTLNLQKAVPSGYMMPDAWHHQMVFGVGQQGVFLTNPQEIVPENVIMEQLSSENVLLVQRKDIVSRWPEHGCDLTLLMRQPDPRWRTFNVLGQIVNVLREEKLPHHMGFRPQLTEYVKIPVWYQCGVTLFMKKENSYYQYLKTLPELEIRTDWKKILKRDKN